MSAQILRAKEALDSITSAFDLAVKEYNAIIDASPSDEVKKDVKSLLSELQGFRTVRASYSARIIHPNMICCLTRVSRPK